jgi:hypothetical protein
MRKWELPKSRTDHFMTTHVFKAQDNNLLLFRLVSPRLSPFRLGSSAISKAQSPNVLAQAEHSQLQDESSPTFHEPRLSRQRSPVRFLALQLTSSQHEAVSEGSAFQVQIDEPALLYSYIIS